jgi:hypothetical protein
MTETYGENCLHFRGTERALTQDIDLGWFEEHLQKTIDEFMRLAPKHGGFISQLVR